MKKFRLKRFLVVFLILIIIQVIVAFADISFYRNDNDLAKFTYRLMSVFSLPIGLIHKGLPFYINEALPIKIVFWLINVFLQTAILLGGISMVRSLREKLKY